MAAHRPLLAAAAVALTALLAVCAAPAARADDTAAAWSVTPSDAAAPPDGRTRFELAAARGGVGRGARALTNSSTVERKFAVYGADGFNTPSGGFDLSPAAEPPIDLGAWVMSRARASRSRRSRPRRSRSRWRSPPGPRPATTPVVSSSHPTRCRSRAPACSSTRGSRSGSRPGRRRAGPRARGAGGHRHVRRLPRAVRLVIDDGHVRGRQHGQRQGGRRPAAAGDRTVRSDARVARCRADPGGPAGRLVHGRLVPRASSRRAVHRGRRCRHGRSAGAGHRDPAGLQHGADHRAERLVDGAGPRRTRRRDRLVPRAPDAPPAPGGCRALGADGRRDAPRDRDRVRAGHPCPRRPDWSCWRSSH